MKKFLLGVVIILIMIWLLGGKKETRLMGPGFIQQIIHQQSIPTPAPVAKPNAPRTFNFDSTTDLKLELEKVNPQVLDSDF